MQIDFFGTADHAEALGLTEFEHETAKQYAVEAGHKAPTADDVRKAKASVTRWNRDRLRAGLGAIV